MLPNFLGEMMQKSTEETIRSQEYAFDITKAPEQIKNLKACVARYDEPLDYEEGDIIEWKPGIREGIRKFPAYGEPVLCYSISTDRENKSNPAAGEAVEILDLCVAVIRSGCLVFCMADSRRFRKYRAPQD